CARAVVGEARPMADHCHNCGAPMHDTRYRACEACRAEWRAAKRKPGGIAEQREMLSELVAAARDVTRMLEAVRYSSGLGQGQIDRLKKAQAIVARAERMVGHG